MSALFDIIVPTFNRYAELPLFFQRNASLRSSDAHVWIIDDCSPNKNTSIIPQWPNLTFIQLEKNRGQAYARNIAIAEGSAPYIVSLDDDAWFEDAEYALAELKKLFDRYPMAGCVMFNIATPTSDYSVMTTGTVLPLHVTCGCAYRRDVLVSMGGFSGFLHSQAEETDISLRIYQAGRNIIFSNEVKVFHNFLPADRPLKWYYTARHNTTRNDLLNVVMYFPGALVVPFVAGKYLSHLKYAITNRTSVVLTFLHTFFAFFSFLKLLPKAISNRRSLTYEQFRYWRKLILSQSGV